MESNKDESESKVDLTLAQETQLKLKSVISDLDSVVKKVDGSKTDIGLSFSDLEYLKAVTGSLGKMAVVVSNNIGLELRNR